MVQLDKILYRYTKKKALSMEEYIFISDGMKMVEIFFLLRE